MNSFLRLLYRDLKAGIWSTKSMIVMQLVTPLFYIFVAGFAYAAVIPTMSIGNREVNYVLFLAPGIIVMQIMFAATLAGAMLWIDKRLAMFAQILMGPFSRWQYILSKVVSIMLQGLLNAFLVFLIASPLLVGLSVSPMGLVYIAGSLILGSLFFGSLTLAISVFIKSNESFNAILNVMFTPLMFLSSVYYPLENAPLAIQTISLVNPLTYSADMLRAGLLGVYVPLLPVEIIALIAVSLAAFIAATIAFRRVKA
ncbi:MAG TPA: ABC transporter permease [Candidatus Krumholzibacteriaceae bacterium]|nr:ABC transporter permease [Candidatus Krumholzibacteriaceae bacterium]